MKYEIGAHGSCSREKDAMHVHNNNLLYQGE